MRTPQPAAEVWMLSDAGAFRRKKAIDEYLMWFKSVSVMKKAAEYTLCIRYSSPALLLDVVVVLVLLSIL